MVIVVGMKRNVAFILSIFHIHLNKARSGNCWMESEWKLENFQFINDIGLCINVPFNFLAFKRNLIYAVIITENAIWFHRHLKRIRTAALALSRENMTTKTTTKSFAFWLVQSSTWIFNKLLLELLARNSWNWRRGWNAQHHKRNCFLQDKRTAFLISLAVRSVTTATGTRDQNVLHKFFIHLSWSFGWIYLC